MLFIVRSSCTWTSSAAAAVVKRLFEPLRDSPDSVYFVYGTCLPSIALKRLYKTGNCPGNRLVCQKCDTGGLVALLEMPYLIRLSQRLVMFQQMYIWRHRNRRVLKFH